MDVAAKVSDVFYERCTGLFSEVNIYPPQTFWFLDNGQAIERYLYFYFVLFILLIIHYIFPLYSHDSHETEKS